MIKIVKETFSSSATATSLAASCELGARCLRQTSRLTWNPPIALAGASCRSPMAESSSLILVPSPSGESRVIYASGTAPTLTEADSSFTSNPQRLSAWVVRGAQLAGYQPLRSALTTFMSLQYHVEMRMPFRA